MTCIKRSSSVEHNISQLVGHFKWKTRPLNTDS